MDQDASNTVRAETITGTVIQAGSITNATVVQVNGVPVRSQYLLQVQRIAPVELHGRSHHRMEADLAHYPPFVEAETGFLALRKAA